MTDSTNNQAPSTTEAAEAKVRANAVVTMTKMDNKLIFTVKGVAEKLTFDIDKVSAENQARAMVHGFKQRIGDGAALSADTETGKAASPEAKFARMKALVDHYMSGSTEWAIKAASGSFFDTDLHVKAILRAGLAKDEAGVETILEMTIKTAKAADRVGALKFWAGTDKVAKAILDIKAESAAKNKSADDIMAEMIKAAAKGAPPDAPL